MVKRGTTTGLVALVLGALALLAVAAGVGWLIAQPAPATADEAGETLSGLWETHILVCGKPAYLIADQCAPPVADFAWSTTGAVVTFFNETTGTPPLAYVWTFGDGGGSTQAHPVYEYQAMGMYTVTLHAVNNCGGDNIAKQVVVPMWPRAFLPLVIQSGED